MRWKRVRFDPVAKRIDSRGIEHPQIDDLWPIIEASREKIVFENPRSDRRVTLATNHVRQHMPDAGRSDGILMLKSHVILFERGFAVEPLARNGAKSRRSYD